MLNVYRASAGTGKTHTLTGEYLQLLFKEKDAHLRILSVTFTNKATAEMKKRIIEELFNLADNQPSDYLDILSENGKKDESAIRMQARRALLSILHDYSSFNISTIDHFFQRTIRAFTREIGLQGNYRIELDETKMMEDSIENMLSDLEKNENKDLLNWLLSFAEDKIEKGEGWDVRRDILILGRQLFKETYKTYGDKIREEINQKQNLTEYRNELYKIIQSTKTKVKELGEKGLQLMNAQGLEATDLKGGSRSPFLIFERLKNGIIKEPSATFRNLSDNSDGYTTSKSSPNVKLAAENLFSSGMNNLIMEVLHLFDNLTDFYTAQEIVRNFYALGILTDLSGHIAKWRDDNNKMFISDTTELLNKVIDGSEIPFIYEKTGTYIKHYMIDEFQDTSAMQWANLRPLVKDSLDNGQSNLIVGDVKQSIYRFRNSDWTLLGHQLPIDFPKQINEKNLNVNWRSYRNVVQFNNFIFNILPSMLQESYNTEVTESSLSEKSKEDYYSVIVSAYENSEQLVSKPFVDKKGHVKIHFLEDRKENENYGDTENEEDYEEKNWKTRSMEALPPLIEQLQQNGYKLQDIAILTRTGLEGLLVAETMLEYKETHPDSELKYDIISEDSLTINSSVTIRWAVSMLKYINQPGFDNNLSMAQIAYSMLKRKNESFNKNNDLLLTEKPNITELFAPFNEEKIRELIQLSQRSLYELAEGLFRLFESDIPENELVFVQAFLDIVTEYSSNETADIGNFLVWWDENGNKKKVVTPDTQNAIRIMTIHKAKGLGFKVVILPFADWKIDQKESFLWCHPTQNPFDKMSIVPVKYSKILKNTYFADDYFHEKLQAYMENINILYVALTRAKEELILFAPKPKNETLSISSLLWKAIQEDEQYLDSGTNIYERGEWQRPVIKREKDVPEEITMSKFRSISPDDRMQLRLHLNENYYEEKRKRGIIIHDILSKIETVNDISKAISLKRAAGEINKTDSEIIQKQLIETLNKESVKKWFDGSLKVMNEVDILFGKGKSCRPDRILIDKNNSVSVIDYKSGELKNEKHTRQVTKYINLIKEMGYEQVEGYVWYLELGEIEKV
jgi:ATP-dependent exoDNAse (exonuclease V) beta subunit